MTQPIRHVFVLMLENRSFDHLLGGLAEENPNIDGIRSDPAWLAKVANPYAGQSYQPYRLTDPRARIEPDPPHGRAEIEKKQLGVPAGGVFPMDGFVRSYADHEDQPPIGDGSQRPPVMGWFGPDAAPVTAFLARNFAVCDHWFAPLPAGTQPNRLMAMSGFTRIDDNRVPMPDQHLVYDWLNERDIRWRVYHGGFPFFTLIPEWIPRIFASRRFRRFRNFDDDLAAEGDAGFPQVTFIEPTYADAPHFGEPNDDHPPAGIANGQRLLWRVYRALAAVPTLFERSVLIVTYDENGGFFDHVSPPMIPTARPHDHKFHKDNGGFASLGVRVPALVISPLVEPGSVHSGVLDHVSILKFIAGVFGDGRYSDIVDARPVGDLRDVLDIGSAPRSIPPIPAFEDYFAVPLAAALGVEALSAEDGAGRTPGTAPETTMEQAFQHALDRIREHPERPPGEYDALLAAFPPLATGSIDGS